MTKLSFKFLLIVLIIEGCATDTTTPSYTKSVVQDNSTEALIHSSKSNNLSTQTEALIHSSKSNNLSTQTEALIHSSESNNLPVQQDVNFVQEINGIWLNPADDSFYNKDFNSSEIGDYFNVNKLTDYSQLDQFLVNLQLFVDEKNKENAKILEEKQDALEKAQIQYFKDYNAYIKKLDILHSMKVGIQRRKDEFIEQYGLRFRDQVDSVTLKANDMTKDINSMPFIKYYYFQKKGISSDANLSQIMQTAKHLVKKKYSKELFSYKLKRVKKFLSCNEKIETNSIEYKDLILDPRVADYNQTDIDKNNGSTILTGVFVVDNYNLNESHSDISINQDLNISIKEFKFLDLETKKEELNKTYKVYKDKLNIKFNEQSSTLKEQNLSSEDLKKRQSDLEKTKQILIDELDVNKSTEFKLLSEQQEIAKSIKQYALRESINLLSGYNLKLLENSAIDTKNIIGKFLSDVNASKNTKDAFIENISGTSSSNNYSYNLKNYRTHYIDTNQTYQNLRSSMNSYKKAIVEFQALRQKIYFYDIEKVESRISRSTEKTLLKLGQDINSKLNNVGKIDRQKHTDVKIHLFKNLSSISKKIVDDTTPVISISYLSRGHLRINNVQYVFNILPPENEPFNNFITNLKEVLSEKEKNTTLAGNIQRCQDIRESSEENLSHSLNALVNFAVKVNSTLDLNTTNYLNFKEIDSIQKVIRFQSEQILEDEYNIMYDFNRTSRKYYIRNCNSFFGLIRNRSFTEDCSEKIRLNNSNINNALQRINDLTIEPNERNLTKNFDVQDSLNRVGEFLEKNTSVKLCVNSYTDIDGTDNFNKKISQDRADSIKKYILKNFKTISDRVYSRGYGETNLLYDDDPRNDKNRRVEIFLSK